MVSSPKFYYWQQIITIGNQSCRQPRTIVGEGGSVLHTVRNWRSGRVTFGESGVWSGSMSLELIQNNTDFWHHRHVDWLDRCLIHGKYVYSFSTKLLYDGP